MMLPLAKLSFLMNVFVGLFVAIALLLILVILIQKGKAAAWVHVWRAGCFQSARLQNRRLPDLGDHRTGSLFLVLAVLMDKYLKTQVSSDLMVPPAQSAPLETPVEGQEAPATPEQAAPAGEQPAQPAAPAAEQPAAPAAEQPAEQPAP